MDKPTSRYKSMRHALETTVSKEGCSAEGTRKQLKGGPLADEAPATSEQPVASEPGIISGELAAVPPIGGAPHLASATGDELAPSSAENAGPSAVQAKSRTGAARSLEEIIGRLAAAESDLYSHMDARVGLAVKLCAVVANAHADGLVLGDIKPSLIQVGILGEVALTDHGSVAPLGSTVAGRTPAGTPAYMSPEQARGEAVDQRSDQYAVGVTCYRLFGGSYPLWDVEPEAFWEKKRRGELDQPSASVIASVPPPLLAICRKALHATPDGRYPHIGAMATEFACYLEGLPVAAYPDRFVDRCARVWRRHHRELLVGALIACASGVVVARQVSATGEARRLQAIAQGEALQYAQQSEIAAGLARESEMRRKLADADVQRGWRLIADLDCAKTLDARLEAVQVNELERVESDAVSLLCQTAEAVVIRPAPHRTFLRWRDGVSEESRIEVEVLNPGRNNWNIDLTVAGDPLTGYRLRVYGKDHFALETISNGWSELLAKVPNPPITDRDHLILTVEHSGSHILVSVDGKQVIDYLDPMPLRGAAHRSVAVGRFYDWGDSIVKHLRIWTRREARMISVLEPGLILLRSGQKAEAKAWFVKAVTEQEYEPLRQEAAFLAAFAESDPAARRTALLALAVAPKHTFALRAWDALCNDALRDRRWNDAVEAQHALQAIEPRPDLLRRCGENLMGLMPKESDAVRPELLRAFARLGATELRLGDLGLTDLSPLAGAHLVDLRAQRNRISDLKPLNGMSITLLDLADNAVVDLTPLAGMPLDRLELAANPLVSLDGLTGSPVQRLGLEHTQVADLTPLAGGKLKDLTIAHTPVADLAPLAQVPLGSLWADGSQISNLAPLAKTPLVNLSLTRCPVADLTPLAGLGKLQRLEVQDTQVIDLAPLRSLGLVELDISRTKVQDLAAVPLAKLKRLTMNDCPVSDLSPLAKSGLTILSLAGAPATNLEPLRGLPLRELDLSRHRRGTLEPLIGVQLTNLALPSGPFSADDLAVMAKLTVQHLDLDPADADQWAAAVLMDRVSTINGVPRDEALRLRDACLELAAGRPADLRQRSDVADGLRLLVLPMRTPAGGAAKLAALAGGRLPAFPGAAQRAAVIRYLAKRIPRRSQIPVGMSCDAAGLARWIDGSLWNGSKLTISDQRSLVAGGMMLFGNDTGFDVMPATLSGLVLVEFPAAESR
jgi:hypothetical protein